MKLTARIHVIAALATTLLTTSAIGGPGQHEWPPHFPTRVNTEAEAMKCCLPGEKVALACKDCKTVREKSDGDKEGVRAWFKADSKHDCSGCGGKITVTTHANGKGPTIGHYEHVCSKCGPGSAFTCATHKG